MRTKRCPWDVWTCFAQNGHLECLKYAHENGCPWDEITCHYADEWSPRVFEIRARNGCPGSLNMRIIFQTARKLTSKERKKERKKERDWLLMFLVS